jgi:hypothetical protein
MVRWIISRFRYHFDLKHYINFAGRIPTVLLNDADAAIVAEVWGNDSKDVYRSAKNIAMITIGTGSKLKTMTNLLHTSLIFVFSPTTQSHVINS